MISFFVKILIGLTFLVPVYPGCPGEVAVKQVPVMSQSEANTDLDTQ